MIPYNHHGQVSNLPNNGRPALQSLEPGNVFLRQLQSGGGVMQPNRFQHPQHGGQLFQGQNQQQGWQNRFQKGQSQQQYGQRRQFEGHQLHQGGQNHRHHQDGNRRRENQANNSFRRFSNQAGHSQQRDRRTTNWNRGNGGGGNGSGRRRQDFRTSSASHQNNHWVNHSFDHRLVDHHFNDSDHMEHDLNTSINGEQFMLLSSIGAVSSRHQDQSENTRHTNQVQNLNMTWSGDCQASHDDLSFSSLNTSQRFDPQDFLRQIADNESRNTSLLNDAIFLPDSESVGPDEQLTNEQPEGSEQRLTVPPKTSLVYDENVFSRLFQESNKRDMSDKPVLYDLDSPDLDPAQSTSGSAHSTVKDVLYSSMDVHQADEHHRGDSSNSEPSVALETQIAVGMSSESSTGSEAGMETSQIGHTDQVPPVETSTLKHNSELMDHQSGALDNSEKDVQDMDVEPSSDQLTFKTPNSELHLPESILQDGGVEPALSTEPETQTDVLISAPSSLEISTLPAAQAHPDSSSTLTLDTLGFDEDPTTPTAGNLNSIAFEIVVQGDEQEPEEHQEIQQVAASNNSNQDQSETTEGYVAKWTAVAEILEEDDLDNFLDEIEEEAIDENNQETSVCSNIQITDGQFSTDQTHQPVLADVTLQQIQQDAEDHQDRLTELQPISLDGLSATSMHVDTDTSVAHQDPQVAIGQTASSGAHVATSPVDGLEQVIEQEEPEGQEDFQQDEAPNDSDEDQSKKNRLAMWYAVADILEEADLDDFQDEADEIEQNHQVTRARQNAQIANRALFTGFPVDVTYQQNLQEIEVHQDRQTEVEYDGSPAFPLPVNTETSAAQPDHQMNEVHRSPVNGSVVHTTLAQSNIEAVEEVQIQNYEVQQNVESAPVEDNNAEMSAVLDNLGNLQLVRNRLPAGMNTFMGPRTTENAQFDLRWDGRGSESNSRSQTPADGDENTSAPVQAPALADIQQNASIDTLIAQLDDLSMQG